MIDTNKFSVAVPWSLSHFIPLNGFHPLYRALFDQRPETISLFAYDNVKLFNALQKNSGLREDILRRIREQNQDLGVLTKDKINWIRLDSYGKPNKVLTGLIPGQLEFLHTAPFPTFQRPFVFHCEMFSSVFFPFDHQGVGKSKAWGSLREYYRKVFSHPLCLGIFSHIPETIKSFSNFFEMEEIDRKLHHSKIGLSACSLPALAPPNTKSLENPKFLFFNSAHQNPKNFWGRGGHIVLRFWKEFRPGRKNGCLYLRCIRPEDKDLRDHGVDLTFLHQEEGKSIFWIENYLSNHEMNALMSASHFFLLPSVSLHSASIMQAMALGAVPVVTDIVGTSRYIIDDQSGIVLKGVFANNWSVHPDMGVLFDFNRQNEALDKELVLQLTLRILALLDAPNMYEKIRLNAMASFKDNFSGEAFSNYFWPTVRDLYSEQVATFERLNKAAIHRQLNDNSNLVLEGCFLKDKDWGRVFESTPQPVLKFYSGFCGIYELGGTFLRVDSEVLGLKPKMDLHDWSVLNERQGLKPGFLAYTTTLGEAVADMFESFNGKDKRAFLLTVLLRKSVKKMRRILKESFVFVYFSILHVFEKSKENLNIGPKIGREDG